MRTYLVIHEGEGGVVTLTDKVQADDDSQALMMARSMGNTIESRAFSLYALVAREVAGFNVGE